MARVMSAAGFPALCPGWARASGATSRVASAICVFMDGRGYVTFSEVLSESRAGIHPRSLWGGRGAGRGGGKVIILTERIGSSGFKAAMNTPLGLGVGALIALVGGFLLGGALREGGATGEAANAGQADATEGSRKSMEAGKIGSGSEAKGGDRPEKEAPVALTRDELRALPDADRLDYLLARFRADPEGAVAEAFQLDRVGGSVLYNAGYGRWLLEMLARADFERAVAVVDELDLPAYRRESLERELAGRRFYDLEDPESAEEILADRRTPVGGFLRSLGAMAKENPARAFDLFERLLRERPESLQHQRPANLLADLARADPVRMESMLATTGPLNLRRYMEGALARALGESNPQAGQRMLERMPASRHRSLAAVHFAAGWGRTDPAAAVAWVRENLSGHVRLQAIAAAIPRDVIMTDPRQVIDWLRELPELAGIRRQSWGGSPLERREAMTGNGGSTLSRSELEALPTIQDVFSQALLELARTDPRGALGHSMHGSEDHPERTDGSLQAQLLGQWVETNPLEALGWFGEQEEPLRLMIAYDEGFQQSVRDLQGEDLRLGIERIAQLQPRQAGDYLMRGMLRGMAERSPDELLSYVDGLPVEMSARLTPAMIHTLAGVDPHRAEGELHRVEGFDRENLERELVNQFREDSPEAAIAFIGRLAPDRPTEALYGEVVGPWADRDWPAARAWYQALPVDARPDVVVAVMEAEGVRQGELQPGDAFRTLAALSGSRHRSRGLRRVVRDWARDDPAAARLAVEQSDLPDAERQSLLERISVESRP